MSNNISRRHLLSTGLAAVGGTLAAGALAAEKEKAAPKTQKAPAKEKEEGPLSLDGLRKLLESMGLKVTKDESTFHFTFPAKLDNVEWNMTMSAVLSTDEDTIWIMAWLNELPKSAADVPRTALLRLLAENDKMGSAFFAYMPSTRRFVLETVIENDEVTTASFREDLLALARHVIDTQAYWTVSEWKATGSSSGSEKETKTTDEAPSILTGTGGAKPIKTATKDAPAGTSSATKKSK